MSDRSPRQLIRDQFPFEPTPDQEVLLDRLDAFIRSRSANALFLMRGYAGTGKTTVVGAIVKALPAMRLKSVLLAPTGRAAKVMALYAGKPAHTIHKKIYQLRIGADGGASFARVENKHTNTIFIVDEASMISGQSQAPGGGYGQSLNLLEDLLYYVYNGVNCRMILIGDAAQLPPVGSALSPALNKDDLRSRYNLELMGASLTQVVRQAAESGILHNATALREKIRSGESGSIRFDLANFPDITRISGEELEEALNDAYGRYDAEGTIVITRSNKRANLFNQSIRARIRWQESELSAGDHLMVVKNNYTWLDQNSKAGFIANGDIVEVLKVRRIQDIYGFRFADVTIRMIDYPDEPHHEVKVLMDTIMTEGPALPQEKKRELFYTVQEDYMDLPSKAQRYAKMRKDPFYNALEVKFAYAVTCHKSQGGQWDAVFVDQGFLKEEDLGFEYNRWLYTALTRARKELFLVNFSEFFF